MLKIRRFFFVLSLAALAANFVFAGENTSKSTKRSEQPFKIKVVAWGPTQDAFDAAKTRVEQSAALKTLLRGARYRLLEFSYVENENKSAPTQPPTRFRAVFYDYTNDRSIVAEGDFAGKETIVAREEYYNPTPNDEEFNEAIAILTLDKRFTDAVKSGALKTFQPMPPTTILDGTIERLVNIGLRSPTSTENEIVSVSIKRGEVIRYDDNAPPQSKSIAGSCGPSSASQQTTSQNTAGQYQMTVMDGANPLWEMLIIRPSASSGTRKSGIEVRDVKYRGKSVLKRGHVPVLNVQYTPASCGPYRDWQWQEDSFATPASGNIDHQPGIREVTGGQVATTVLQTGIDTGNHRGVAIYQQNNGYGMEVVLITELQAGWYRYIHEWRFAPDGTIRPRYGFGATNNSCVCDVHNHHAYWRFDFDIVQPNNNVYQVERGRKFLQPLATETTRVRNHQTRRSLLIQNAAGNEAYMLVPNLTDGVVDTFGVSDFWVLQYKTGGTPVSAELDDGETCVNCSNTTAAIRINPFMNGESVANQDVVLWYGVHFIHSDGANLLDSDRYGNVISGSHVVGPDLRPVRW